MTTRGDSAGDGWRLPSGFAVRIRVDRTYVRELITDTEWRREMLMSEIEQVPRVPDSELAYNEELVYRHGGLPFTGVGYEETDAGVLVSEIRYQDGLQDGISQDFYPNGAVGGESNYRENVLHGWTREFDDRGNVYDRGNVLSEALHGYGILVVASARDASGRLRQTFRVDERGFQFELLKKWRLQRGWAKSMLMGSTADTVAREVTDWPGSGDVAVARPAKA